MADVPDHLAPATGLTNSNLRFAALELDARANVVVRFDITDEEGDEVGSYFVPVRNAGQGVAGSIADAHEKMVNTLRQWLHETDVLQQHYAKVAGHERG